MSNRINELCEDIKREADRLLVITECVYNMLCDDNIMLDMRSVSLNIQKRIDELIDELSGLE